MDLVCFLIGSFASSPIGPFQRVFRGFSGLVQTGEGGLVDPDTSGEGPTDVETQKPG